MRERLAGGRAGQPASLVKCGRDSLFVSNMPLPMPLALKALQVSPRGCERGRVLLWQQMCVIKIELNQELVDSTIEQMAVSYEQPDQVRAYYRQNQQARSSIEGMVLEDQVVDHILESAQVTEKEVGFEDLMSGNL